MIYQCILSQLFSPPPGIQIYRPSGPPTSTICPPGIPLPATTTPDSTPGSTGTSTTQGDTITVTLTSDITTTATNTATTSTTQSEHGAGTTGSPCSGDGSTLTHDPHGETSPVGGADGYGNSTITSLIHPLTSTGMGSPSSTKTPVVVSVNGGGKSLADIVLPALGFLVFLF